MTPLKSSRVVGLLEKGVSPYVTSSLEPPHIRDRKGGDLHIHPTDITTWLGPDIGHHIQGMKELFKGVFGGFTSEEEETTMTQPLQGPNFIPG